MRRDRAGKRILGELTRKLKRAERHLLRIDKAEREGRGQPRGLMRTRHKHLDDFAAYSFALDVLRQAYDRQGRVA